MQVVAIQAHGGLDQVKLDQWPEPLAATGQVVVRVRACALNYLDIFVRRGMPGLAVEMPRIPGGDVAGTVAVVGPSVDPTWLGRRVLLDPHVNVNGHRGALGENANGGLCEYLAVASDNLIALPDDVTFEMAAALPIAYGTAHRMVLTRGRVSAGQTVLVLGASGGVGTACVQLAKNAGARVIACGSTSEKLEQLRRLGADHVINSETEDFSRRAWDLSGRRGVDVVINFTGGPTWVPSLRALGREGRLLTCGATAGFQPPTDIRYIWTRELNVIGSNGWEREDLVALLEKVRSGQIKPVIDRVLRIEQAVEGMALLEARQVFGKIVVTV